MKFAPPHTELIRKPYAGRCHRPVQVIQVDQGIEPWRQASASKTGRYLQLERPCLCDWGFYT